MAAPAATDQAWEAVIGLETHVQLGTESKIFTGASTRAPSDSAPAGCRASRTPPGRCGLEQSGSPKAMVEGGVGMISESAAITALVEELLASHPTEVEAFRFHSKYWAGFDLEL